MRSSLTSARSTSTPKAAGGLGFTEPHLAKASGHGVQADRACRGPTPTPSCQTGPLLARSGSPSPPPGGGVTSSGDYRTGSAGGVGDPRLTSPVGLDERALAWSDAGHAGAAGAMRRGKPRPGPAALRRVLWEAIKRLQEAGIDTARREAEWLLAHLVGCSPLELYLEEIRVPAHVEEQYCSSIQTRAAGVPLQYLLGETDFCGATFTVNPGVFIPRPETEAIVEQALEAFRAQAPYLATPLRILDLGTGSGCIAVTLARRLPACVVVGVELSWTALRTAHQNLLRHGSASNVHLVQGRWLDAIRGPVDGIVSNPPYVPSAQVNRLPVEVRQEPRLSLDGGEDGMRELRDLLAEAPRVLRPGGLVVLECGETHAEVLVHTASREPWVKRVGPLYDVASRPRGVLVVS